MTADDIRKEFKHLGEPEPAITYGRLVDVDPETGCATLDVYQDDRIPLRFDDSMKSEALRLNGKSVKVKGHGWYDDHDNCVAVVIEELEYPAAKPFDLDKFLNDPNPKLFDPDTVPKLEMSDEEWDAFEDALWDARGKARPIAPTAARGRG